MSTREKTHRVYRFGEFSLDIEREALYRGDDERHLRPKAFRVLRFLLENSRRLVSKAELHDAVWERAVVTDDSLAHCVADIRRALGDSDFEMIKTVPRRGYILDHAVHREAEALAEASARRNRLTFRPGAVAAGLAAALLLLLGAGRFVELPPAAADAGGDAAAPQAEPPDTGIDAFNEHERGRFFFNRRGDGDIARAEACFKAALEQDSEFGAAWTGLAGVYSVRIGTGELALEEGLPLLGDATHHATRLAPESAEAHARRAHYLFITGEHLLAQEAIERAIVLDPNDVLVLGMAAGELAHNNRIDEAIELQRRAVRSDPTSALLHHNLAWYLLAAGRYAEASAVADQYNALYPPGVGDAGELFADVELLQGNYEQALVRTRALASPTLRDRNLAIIHHALGQEAEADAAFRRLLGAGHDEARIRAAEVLAQREKHAEALHLLSGTLDSRQHDEPTRNQVRRDTLRLLSPYLAALRSDERWQAMYSEVLEARGNSKIVALESSRRAAQRQ